MLSSNGLPWVMEASVGSVRRELSWYAIPPYDLLVSVVQRGDCSPLCLELVCPPAQQPEALRTCRGRSFRWKPLSLHRIPTYFGCCPEF